MKFSSNDKISNNQLRAIISSFLFGSLAVSLPLRTIEISKSSAYISILLGGIFISVWYYFMAKIFQKTDIKNYEEDTLKIFGKRFGKLLLAVIFINILICSSFRLFEYSNMINSVTDKNTNFLTAIFFIVLVSGFMAQKGIECIGRTSEIAFIVMIFSMLLIFLMAVRNIDFDILIPVFSERKEILKGAFDSFLSFDFAGYIFLLMPKSNNRKNCHKYVLTAFFTVYIVLAFTTALSVSSFGIKESQRKIWPVIQMMNYIDFPSSLVERQEVLMSGFYIFSVFILAGTGIYILSVLLEIMFETDKKKVYIFVSAVLLLISAYIINILGLNISIIIKSLNVLTYFLILLLPVKIIIRRKRK